MLPHIWLAVAFPLLGALLNGLFGKRLTRLQSGAIGSGAILLAFVTVLLGAWDYATGTFTERSGPYYELTLWPWIHSGNLHIDIAFLVDPLSIVMMLLVTGVSFLIHIYSTGYMAHDEGFPRFFCYLNLFVAMMLILVMGNSLPLMFVGWEGVGLCSYLLIGFWYTNMENAKCGMKAFVVNRIGDFGVLLGMFIIFTFFGTLDFVKIFSSAGQIMHSAPAWMALAACLLLFLGATGKSAQLPLHVWLPDAMAGPTPVSALIHAATMVTAGVYMVTRMNPLFSAAPQAGMVVAIVGALTAFMAATIAMTQNDIKKVLAYSTVSQLGFMFLACGVGAYWVAIFHVLTHAFFKACLFLGSGSVIHGMHEEQDTRVMGGLAKYMKFTYFTFLISTFAIAGIFPLSGFFSKDEILWQVAVWQASLPWLPSALYILALGTAFMTAFYMGRVTFKTFLGEPRWTQHFKEHQHHPHESPASMTMPLVVLAALAVIGGFVLFVPAWFPGGGHMLLEHWLSPSAGGQEQLAILGLAHATETGHGEAMHHEPFVTLGSVTATEVAFALLSVALALWALLGLALPMFTKRIGATERLKQRYAGFYAFSLNKWYVDELYNRTICWPGVAFARKCWQSFDLKFIDGIVNGVAWLIGALGMLIRPLQTGFVRNYALYLLLGAIIYVAISAVKG